jgi:hypothetical protein
MGPEPRREFPALLGDLASLRPEQVDEPLWEIASGIGSFGADADPTWIPWLHYLLVAQASRPFAASSRALPLLVSGVIAAWPQADPSRPYDGFFADLLCTLGRRLMATPPWRDDDPFGWIADANRRHDHWHDPQEDFTALAFLHAKYLPAAQVPAWIASVLDVPHPVWRGQVLPWLVGMHSMLAGEVDQPADWREEDLRHVQFEGSYLLRGRNDGDHTPGREPPPPALPPANRAALLATVRRRMNVERLCEWLDSFAPYPSLHANLFDVPERFTRLYLD